MGESASVDELTIVGGVCVAVNVTSSELRAGSAAMSVIAGTLQQCHENLLAVMNELEAPGGLAGLSAAMLVQPRLATTAVTLHLLITRIAELADGLEIAAANYEASEAAAAGLWSRAGGAHLGLVDVLLSSPHTYVTKPLSRLTTSLAAQAREAQLDADRDSLLGWLTLGGAGLLSGVAYAGELSALDAKGWAEYRSHLRTAAFLLPTALSPVFKKDHPGIDREQGAMLAQAVAGTVSPGGEVADGAKVVGDGVNLVHWALGAQRISMSRTETRTSNEPIRTFGESIAVMEELTVESGGPGKLRIDKVTSEEGDVSWQVFIPGGQGFDPYNVHALSNAPSAVISQPTPSLAMIATALRDVGATKGEPIVMVGHSHGGITGSMFANNSRLRAEFDVPLVVTAGSPVDEHDIRPDTHLLSLDHTEDLIPGTDGVASSRKPGMTRVERTLAESADPQIAGGSGIHHAHDYPNYVNTAELVDAHPDLQHLQDYYSSIIPEGEVETFIYQGAIE